MQALKLAIDGTPYLLVRTRVTILELSIRSVLNKIDRVGLGAFRPESSPLEPNLLITSSSCFQQSLTSDKRYMICNKNMKEVFKTDRVYMFTMNRMLSNHLLAKERM